MQSNEFEMQLQSKIKILQQMQQDLIKLTEKQRKEMQKQKEELAQIQTMMAMAASNQNSNQMKIMNEINDSISKDIIEYKCDNQITKILKKSIQNENIQTIVGEYEINKRLHHPNILKTYGLFFGDEKSPSSILLEFCPYTLEQAIKKKLFSKVQHVYLICQIAETMKYVHSCSIYKMNLNPSNIFITEDGKIKLCKFSISNSSSDELKFATPTISNGSQPPEICDIYSFGILVYFILTEGKLPDSDDFSQFSLLSQQLLEACLDLESSNQPDFEVICEILEENDFNLLSLSDHEIQEVSEMIRKYKEDIATF